MESDLSESQWAELEGIAENLRRQPYRIFTHNCYHKSWKFVKAAARRGIKAKLRAVVGLARARLPLLGWKMTVPALHAWAEVKGRRIEVSRPLGHKGVWDIVPLDIKPLLSIRFSPKKHSGPPSFQEED